MNDFIKFCIVWMLMMIAIEGKTSFIKDLKTDIPFPPVNTESISGIPDGHLRPLGWQRKPEGKVREEKEKIGAQTFHLRYAKTIRPVVMRGVLKTEPVLEKWEQDSYLKDKFGQVNITITVKKEFYNQGPQHNKRRMLLRKFLLDYKYENWYLSSTVHDDLMPELPLPEILSCGSYKQRLTEAEMWMSSGGTASLLHSHGDHNLHCVIDGRKDFILIDPQYKENFKFQETYENSGSGHSAMDMDMINMFKFSKIAQTPWYWSTLWQGDCIYVPAGYLHQVRSFGRGISYTVQFAPVKDFDSTDCKKESKSKRRKKDKKVEEKDEKEKIETEKITLADVDFIWAFSNGERHLKEKKLVPSTLRRILLILMRDGDQLHKTVFKHFYEDALAGDNQKLSADEVFNILTPNDARSYLSRDEIKVLNESRLQQVCTIFNKKQETLHDEL
ncbi:hypothetical protein ACF0H5_022586 [Mactra antiquata]